MNERDIIALFQEIAKLEKCPDCGSQIEGGGVYNPEELVKGPSNGVVAVKVPVEVILNADQRSETFARPPRFLLNCRWIYPDGEDGGIRSWILNNIYKEL